MATRKSTKKTTTSKNNTTKADHIRDWFAANPNGTAVECQKRLAEQGVEVGSGQCQQILNKKRGGGKVDVNTIKTAAEFVATYGDIDAALEAIDGVGEFISTCGSPAKAKAALEYQSVAAVLK